MGRDEGLSTPNESHLQELKQRQIEEADIVVCTLNYAGNSQFDPFCVTQPTQNPSFDCLIVDEASQCLELDIFIPLRLGIRRVLLVGDPEQLPPTVVSSRASNAKFGQSLMDRLYSLFKSNDLIRMMNIVSTAT
jgi:senataxin